MDGLAPLPAAASWRHRGTRSGFEVVFFPATPAGHLLTGRTTADDGETAWSLGYTIAVDDAWRTTEVRASASTAAGEGSVHLTRDERDGWAVDGEPRPELHGCVDVDFESSAMTNTLPVHRLALRRGERVEVPAAFVRAPDLRVERLEQAYTLTDATSEGLVFQYESSTFGFACELRYDAAGLVIDYPGIALRHG